MRLIETKGRAVFGKTGKKAKKAGDLSGSTCVCYSCAGLRMLGRWAFSGESRRRPYAFRRSTFQTCLLERGITALARVDRIPLVPANVHWGAESEDIFNNPARLNGCLRLGQGCSRRAG